MSLRRYISLVTLKFSGRTVYAALLIFIISAVDGCATIYVAARSPKYVVVAMDTRMVEYGALTSTEYDDYCKLVPLGDQRFFFMASIDDRPRNMDTYGAAAEIAQNTYKREPGVNIETLATRWANEFADHYRDATGLSLGVKYIGVFGGIDNNGELSVYKGTVIWRIIVGTGIRSLPISVDKFTDDSSTARVQYQISSQDDYFHLRRGSNPSLNQGIANEILQQQTAGATRLLDGLKATYHWSLPINDTSADGAAFLVTAAANGLILSGGDAWSGGQISTIIIEKSQKARWLYQLPFCPTLAGSPPLPVSVWLSMHVQGIRLLAIIAVVVLVFGIASFYRSRKRHQS